MRIRFLVGCFVTGVSLIPGYLGAAETFLLDEITIRGAKESPREESLTIREVRESPAKDIGEALQRVEGISCVRKGAIANDIVLRGFQRDNINVLVDGVRLHGACPNRMDPPAFHYDFAQVEDVLVLKGPYDVTNPGGLGGLVQVKTKKTEKGFHSDVNLNYGSYNSSNDSATLSYGTDRYDALGGYAFKFSEVPRSGDGKLITDIYPSTSPNRYRPDAYTSKAYEMHTGWAKFGFNPSETSRTELSYSYQDASHVLYPYLKMDADYDRTHILNWTYKVEKISDVFTNLELQAYWNKVNHVMDDSLRESSRPTARITRLYSMLTDARTQVVGAKLNGTLAIGPGSLKTGADYYNRGWNALNVRAMFTQAVPYTTLNMIPDVDVDNFGLFAEYELPLNDLFTVQAGIRGDLTWVNAAALNNASAQRNNTDFGEVSGNVRLTYTPVSSLDIFVGLARGVRTPDPEELYISVPAAPPAVSWQGNPDLKPTVNHEADLGVKYAGEKFYVNGTIFYSDLTDFVNFHRASSTMKSYQNIDASMWGAEFGSQVSLPFDLYLRGSLSYTEARNKDGNRPLAEIPPLRGLLSLRYDVDSWFFEVAENWAARQDRVDSGLNEQPTGGWLTTDLKAGINWQALSIYGGVNNLLDKQYYSHLSYLRDPFAGGVGFKVPENGRNFYLTVMYKF
ncbi:MAG: TonB-dependent receptor [Deltaproteobacteria bacterium]|nr:TonB-dependent receptor [Deltaproteobacteria bacterium]TLN04178.1 MAG: TonB-dependent receptor [bacterium]